MRVKYEIVLKDIGAIVEKQRLMHKLQPSIVNISDFAYDKYHPVEEVHAWIDQIVQTYPHLATSFIVGQSYEKRDLKVLKISSNKTAMRMNGTPVTRKKAVWWDGGLYLFSLPLMFHHIFVQGFMLVNGLVQRPTSTSSMHCCQIIAKIQRSHISLINLISISCLYSMSMVMPILGRMVDPENG